MAVCQTSRGRSYGRAPYCAQPGKYVGLATLERARTDSDDDNQPSGGGLDFGITSFDVRVLTDNPWNGGGGYTYTEVARMTPDQIYHRLCNRDVLRVEGGRRLRKGSAPKPDADGNVHGVAADGSPIIAKVTGPSLVKQIKGGLG